MGHNRTTILVVDDEENIQELIRYNLEKSGYHVVSSGTGSDALTIINAGNIDLVVLDLMLPDIDGVELCKMIRKMKNTLICPLLC